MIIGSGATSHFISKDIDLPEEGESNKTVHLPNGDTLQTTHRTSLPFQKLTNQESKRSTHPPTPATFTDEHTQIVR
jgi:hypothetical protein